MRGLNGTGIRALEVGNLAVLLDQRLVPVPLSETEQGRNLVASLGAASKVLRYDDLAALPWRVGHLRAMRKASDWLISSTRRSPSIIDDWELPEQANDGAFVVELVDSSNVISIIETGASSISAGGDPKEVRVAERGRDGRIGEWVSITLNAA